MQPDANADIRTRIARYKRWYSHMNCPVQTLIFAHELPGTNADIRTQIARYKRWYSHTNCPVQTLIFAHELPGTNAITFGRLQRAELPSAPKFQNNPSHEHKVLSISSKCRTDATWSKSTCCSAVQHLI